MRTVFGWMLAAGVFAPALIAARQPPIVEGMPALGKKLGNFPVEVVTPGVEHFSAWSAAVAPGGKSFAYCGAWGTYLLSLPDGKLIRKFEEPFKLQPKGDTVGPDGKVTRRFGEPTEEHPRVVAITPDGKRLIGAGRGLRVWEVATGKLLVAEKWEWERVPKALGDGITYCPPTISADGTRVYAAYRGDSVMVLDAETGKPVTRILDFGSEPDSLSASPDGQFLAVTTVSGVRLWDAARPKELTRINLKPPPEGGSLRYAARFSPDGKQLLVTGPNGTHLVGQFLVWDVAKKEFVMEVPNPYPNNVRRHPLLIGLIGDGRYAVCTDDLSPRVDIYDLKEKQTVGVAFTDKGSASPFAPTPDGKFFVGQGSSGKSFLLIKSEDLLKLIPAEKPEKKQ